MKKLFLATFLFVFVLCANAQVQFGVKAGLNIANEVYSASGFSMSPKSLIGFHAGVIVDIGLGPIAIQPGLLFSQKGTKMDDGSSTTTTTFNYIDIPINLVYKIGLPGIKVLLNAGPSFSYALTGKSDGENILTGNEGDANKADFGLGFGGGVQVGSIQALLNYNLGLANIMNTPSGSDLKVKNNVFSISLVYMFGGK